jgi:hypothetical protein
MTNVNQDLAIAQTIALITRYGFDLGDFTVEQLMEKWLQSFHANWIRLATIEALYLGRYKAISIEQILTVWSRLGSAKIHFSHEFERLISRKLPRYLANLSDEFEESSSEDKTVTSPGANLNLLFVSNDLEPSNSNQDSLPSLSEPQEPPPMISEPEEESQIKESESSFSPASALGLPHQPNPSRSKAEQKPIHKFTPLPDFSSFYHKLKALAQRKSEEE